MFDRIYIEEAVRDLPMTRKLIERFPKAEQIACERYGEVFNPKRQNFRAQKRNPALILAEKKGNRVLPTPPDYGLGADHHFYFSHMLNCLYDCRYCFLQGMYQSANYLLFVNFDDFIEDIRSEIDAHPGERCFFFSGYDCDSLAMDSVTGFVDRFLPLFSDLPTASLELRTKSVNTASLLKREPIENVVTAFSLNPEPVAEALEHKAPSVDARLAAINKLASAGWKIGLRFDPLIYFKDAVDVYQDFIDRVFNTVPMDAVHSVTLGAFRSPKTIFKKMESLYPEEPLFMGNLQLQGGMISYAGAIEDELIGTISDRILGFVNRDRFFPCQ